MKKSLTFRRKKRNPTITAGPKFFSYWRMVRSVHGVGRSPVHLEQSLSAQRQAVQVNDMHQAWHKRKFGDFDPNCFAMGDA